MEYSSLFLKICVTMLVSITVIFSRRICCLESVAFAHLALAPAQRRPSTRLSSASSPLVSPSLRFCKSLKWCVRFWMHIAGDMPFWGILCDMFAIFPYSFPPVYPVATHLPHPFALFFLPAHFPPHPGRSVYILRQPGCLVRHRLQHVVRSPRLPHMHAGASRYQRTGAEHDLCGSAP